MPSNDIRPLPPLSAKDIQRFWRHVDKTPGQGPHGECWGWKMGADKNGYGRFSSTHKKKRFYIRVPRIAFFVQHGKDPVPFLVLHECDWPPCCRGEHLKSGTNRDNMDDRSDRGRTAAGDKHWHATRPEVVVDYARGERRPEAKLTDEKVIELFRLRLLGFSYAEIARKFHISAPTAQKAGTGKTWKHVKRPPIEL